MGDIRSLVWLVPVLFMLHDFEEIILLKTWLTRNHDSLLNRFPKVGERFMPHFEKISTAAFALGVAEEYVLICAVCVVSLLTNWYALWFGMLFAFLIHLLAHIVQAIAIKKYVPSLATSILFLPTGCSIALLAIRQEPVSYGSLLLYTFLSVAVMLVNLVAVHKGMDIFERFVNRNK